jgi:DNA-binding transcriptional LysR family regulator
MFTPKITLDQWRAFHAVVEYGGFAQAAAALSRSQSSVSYNVKQLQIQLNCQLLEIDGRKAKLTDTGHHLLLRAEHLLQQAQDLETFAASLTQGWESEIRLVVDTMFPSGLLMSCLKRFSESCPNIRVQLDEVVLSGARDALEQHQADLVIGGQIPDGRLEDVLLELEFCAVAHPGHPLHALDRPITENDLCQHTQVIIRDSGTRSRIDVGWQSTANRWSVGSIEKAINSLVAGLGFGWLPEHRIQPLLDSGQLKPLNLASGKQYTAFLYLLFANKQNPGPGTKRLADIIQQAANAHQGT